MLTEILQTPAARQLQQLAYQHLSDVLEEAVTLAQIPAPTFAEQARAAHVKRRMAVIGLTDIDADEAGNVVGRWPGSGGGPTLLLAAHMDSVFPADTALRVRREADTLHGPGICDNASGLAAMIWTAHILARSNFRLAGDVLFAATSGEEGLGDLRGMREVMRRFGSQVDYVIPVDGSLGGMVRQAVGVRRLEVTVTAEGGHSWGAFGATSAVHVLGRIIARLSEIRVPQNPKTTYNVGVISGGTSINTIAAVARAQIDLRSISPEELKRLEAQVRRMVQMTAEDGGARADLTVIGDRPVGSIAESHPLCQAVRAVHQHLNIQTRVYPSSTDGNIPLSQGIPAVTIGVTIGGNGHRTDEYIHTAPMAKGLAQILLVLLAAQQLEPRVR